jgi:hypothetical protein
MDNVVTDQLKIGIIHEMSDIFLPTGKKIIQAEHLMPFGKQAFTQVRPQKSRAAGYEYSHCSPSINNRNTVCMIPGE